MFDTDTFLLQLYYIVDTFCKTRLPYRRPKPGPPPSLCVSEVLTLVLFGQGAHFQSERDFYRWAQAHLRAAFPTLPAYSQFNRLERAHQAELVAFFRYTVEIARAPWELYEILDAYGVAIRHPKRRGRGWLPLAADRGFCSRLGWYTGFGVLDAVTSEGIVTGFGYGAASVKDQTLAETFLAARAQPQPGLGSVGDFTEQPYLADKGFPGQDYHLRCGVEYGACILNSPRVCDPEKWPTWLLALHKGMRQIVESVHDKLLNTFRLDSERPHTLGGFNARLTAKEALHNFCIWLNKQVGRHPLEFADLIAW
jgi:hypothetical protein